MDYYLATRRNELLIHATGMNYMIFKGKKPDTEHMLYDATYVKLERRQTNLLW